MSDRINAVADMLEKLALQENRSIDAERAAIQALEWEETIYEIPSRDLLPAMRRAHRDHDGFGLTSAGDVLAAWRAMRDEAERATRKPTTEHETSISEYFRGVAITREQAKAAAARMETLIKAGDKDGVRDLVERCAKALVSGATRGPCGLMPDLGTYLQTIGGKPQVGLVCTGYTHVGWIVKPSGEWVAKDYLSLGPNKEFRRCTPCPHGPLAKLEETKEDARMLNVRMK